MILIQSTAFYFGICPILLWTGLRMVHWPISVGTLILRYVRLSANPMYRPLLWEGLSLLWQMANWIAIAPTGKVKFSGSNAALPRKACSECGTVQWSSSHRETYNLPLWHGSGVGTETVFTTFPSTASLSFYDEA